MITFLYGTYGSGKTTTVLDMIAQDTARGIHTFLLVPEQEAVQSERKTLEHLPPSSQLSLEVLNFSRLYNRVCREYGGLSYHYVTRPMRSLLMWQNLRELSPFLEEYGRAAQQDSSFGEIMLRAVGELKACGVTAEALERAAERLPEDGSLRGRIRDLALIYASFDRLIAEHYSDSADDLARLRDLLDRHNFFRDCHIYIDSFTSFTAVEHQIIERMFAQAARVTVTVPLPHPKARDISNESIRESLKRLHAAAERKGGYRERLLPRNLRAASPALCYLIENLWRLDVSRGDGTALPDGSIVTEQCDTPYAEAEAASAHILDLLRDGARARDIVIVLRDPEHYRGILEPALERAEIPFFFSEKSDLCTMPPVKLLLTALRIKQYNWRREDVISHIKTGLCDLTDEDADLFEEYIQTWNINGARFLGNDFSMNPDGYEKELSPRGQAILDAANRAKRILTAPLQKLFVLLDASETVADMCRALYVYLREIHLEEKLAALSAKELSKGYRKQAEEYASLFGVILQTLADIGTALAEESATTEELSQILRLVFSETSIGTIPTSVDEVTVGSAAMLRAAEPKYVMILGLREGEFPAAVKEKNLLSETDRAALLPLGIELSASDALRSSDELMYVQRAFAAPSEKLYLFTSVANATGEKASASLPFLRVEKLFPSLTPHRYRGGDFRYLASSPKNAVAHLRELAGTPDGTTLTEALEDSIPGVRVSSVAEASEPDCQMEVSLVRDRLKDTVRLSPTAFETYVKCPFDYFCKYFLELREKKTAGFRAVDMGTFVHEILEQAVPYLLTPKENGELPSEDELKSKTRELAAAYVAKVDSRDNPNRGKLNHLYGRLEELALLLVRNLSNEFRESDFRPAFYELSVNGREGAPSPLSIPLTDGATVSLEGKIDRVDVLRKDGQVYLRVVDYKTGSKDFHLDSVTHGLNTQMLFYLFSLCYGGSPSFCRELGLEEGKTPRPAGVVYLSSDMSVVDAEDYDSIDNTLQKAEKELSRSGLLLADEEILAAMNHSCSTRFLVKGVSKKKDGSFSATDALATAEQFELLRGKLTKTVADFVTRLRSGCADAAPTRHTDKLPCDYCRKKPFCRKQNS